MNTKKIILASIVLLTVAGLTYAACRNLWMSIYFEEALYNTLFPDTKPLPPDVRPLLSKGTVLEAKTVFGFLQIEALDDQTRRYRWRPKGNATWNEELIRLKGGDGPYLMHPGNRSENLPTYLGLKRNIIVFESENDCRTEDQLYDTLRNYHSAYGAVYNNSGLVVGFSSEGSHFIVVQMRLKGQIPKNLPGADDSAIVFR